MAKCLLLQPNRVQLTCEGRECAPLLSLQFAAAGTAGTLLANTANGCWPGCCVLLLLLLLCRAARGVAVCLLLPGSCCCSSCCRCIKVCMLLQAE
jgi:hypothetical protein